MTELITDRRPGGVREGLWGRGGQEEVRRRSKVVIHPLGKMLLVHACRVT